MVPELAAKLSPLGGLTVNKKLVLAVREPSLTVRVIVALPVRPVAGVTVTVRLVPLPPRTMLAVGTRVGLEDPRETVKFVAEVWVSPTVNPNARVEVFWTIV